MATTSVSVHEHDDDPLDVKLDLVTDGTMHPYVRLNIGPACFFVHDPMTLMKLTAMTAGAFNDLSAALREAGTGSTLGAM